MFPIATFDILFLGSTDRPRSHLLILCAWSQSSNWMCFDRSEQTWTLPTPFCSSLRFFRTISYRTAYQTSVK